MAERNVAIVGAGPGGYVAAIRAAQLGQKVTLVEREKAGGTCLHRGCIPSKALLHGAHVFETVQRAAEFGVRLPGPATVDYAALAARKDKVVAQLEKGVEFLLNKRGVKLLKGEASFASPKELSVRGADGTLTALPFDACIVATGGVPVELPGFPMDGTTYVTSNEVLRWTSLPASLAIIGAGVIGCEFASCYARLGVQVTVIELMDAVLPGFDADVRAEVGRGLKKQKIELMLGAKVEEAGHGPAGASLTLDNGETLSAQACIIAVGRRASCEGLAPEKAGLALTAKGALAVDESCRTSVDGIYAIGDVTGVAPLAHTASHMGIVAAETIAGHKAKFDVSKTPWAVFCKPEVAFIGLTEEQARKDGREVKVGKFAFRGLGKPQAIGEIDGFIKVIADAKSGAMLGFHAVGHEATDLLGEASIAWQSEASIQDFAETIHAHPTLTEAVGEAALAALGRPIHGI